MKYYIKLSLIALVFLGFFVSCQKNRPQVEKPSCSCDETTSLFKKQQCLNHYDPDLIIDGPLNSFFIPVPIICKGLLSYPVYLQEREEKDEQGASHKVLSFRPVKGEVKAKEYVHFLYSKGEARSGEESIPLTDGELDLEFFFEPENPIVKDIISEEDLDKLTTMLHKDFEDYHLEAFRTVSFDWPIGLTKVKSFKIVADKTLFGVEAGEDLSPFFYIKYLYPNQVISYGKTWTIGLKYKAGYRELAIADWLKLKPTMSASMALALKEVPKEAPLSVTFTTSLRTTKGNEIKSSAQVKLIK